MVLSYSARQFVEALSPAEREACYRALSPLFEDPYPNGYTKVPLGFPYRPGTFGFASGEFWMTYTFLNAMTVWIGGVSWSPDSPNYPTGLR